MKAQINPVVAVEFDLFDGSATKTLRLSNGNPSGPVLTATVDGARVLYEPRLYTPIQLGARISADQYGQAQRGASNGGQIDFALSEGIWPWLGLHWKGRPFRVYLGEAGAGYDDLALVYAGRVDDLTHDTVKASVKTADASLGLDVPLVPLLYQEAASVPAIELLPGVLDKEIAGDTALSAVECSAPGIVFSGVLAAPARITFAAGFVGIVQVKNATSGGFALALGLASGITLAVPAGTALSAYCDGANFSLASGGTDQTTLASLKGLPKPRLRGQCFSAAPVLEVDGTVQTWRLSTTPLAEVSQVTVGGIPWQEVPGTPAQGQWSADLAGGTIQLGSVTLGGEVRCDAKGEGWESLTSAALIEEIVTEAGGAVDIAAMAQFAAAAPQLVGLYTATTPINILDALDQIALGIGGWWEFGPDGTIRAGVIAAPQVPEIALSDVEISTLQLSALLPPAWRIRVEYRRNWMPGTNFFQAVTAADQFILSQPGLVAAAYDNIAILAAEPRAVDVPLIRSLVVTEADAIAIRDRLVLAWSLARRLYDVTAWIDPASVALYATVEAAYQMVNGNFRVHSAVRSIGGGMAQLQLWG